MPSREHLNSFIEMVEAGQYIEAMEAFHAADATVRENSDPRQMRA